MKIFRVQSLTELSRYKKLNISSRYKKLNVCHALNRIPITFQSLTEENSSSSGFRSFPQYRHRPPNVVHVLEVHYSSTLEVWTVELIVGEKKGLTINDDSNALVVLINLSQAIIKGEKSYKKL